MGANTKGIMAGRKGFCAEHKPGHPHAHNERMINHLELQIEALTAENAGLRKEIGRLSRRYTETYRVVKKVFTSGAGV